MIPLSNNESILGHVVCFFESWHMLSVCECAGFEKKNSYANFEKKYRDLVKNYFWSIGCNYDCSVGKRSISPESRNNKVSFGEKKNKSVISVESLCKWTLNATVNFRMKVSAKVNYWIYFWRMINRRKRLIDGLREGRLFFCESISRYDPLNGSLSFRSTVWNNVDAAKLDFGEIRDKTLLNFTPILHWLPNPNTW